MEERFTILGIAGSLRRGSYNRMLLRAAAEELPEEARLDSFDLEGLPLFNQDLEADPSLRVRELKNRIRAADAVLIATPEYNYSVPGVLKNAIDLASRPYGDNAWDGKPVAVMGASTGLLGTGRAQYHLRQSFVFLNMYPVNGPEVMVTFAPEKFDAEGRLTDPAARELVRHLVRNLIHWTRTLRGELPVETSAALGHSRN
jgi:chromate reductase